jgi:hypothetical protein
MTVSSSTKGSFASVGRDVAKGRFRQGSSEMERNSTMVNDQDTEVDEEWGTYDVK